MSIASEHRRMQAVLDQARRFDIASNHDPQAIFEAGSAGFQVWCTPEDRPRGWDDIKMLAGAFSKPCEFVGSVGWEWKDEEIVGVQIETTAYALADQKPDQYSQQTRTKERSINNRREDIDWLRKKVTWLFQQANVPLLPFVESVEDAK